ncbi:autotransporter outer membrane beta-barrel domain-containing protein [Flavobacterium caeni]|uniref:Autotransporter beta-domain-containing protein n=1 Tax=Flavobacterium caeni TaxID=490189 RepID=A0A1G5BGK9_9FLAO|nr:autotransporter outer membrane beta-barrel domain-containing protein [Flavobacterium caeni]SCX89249.1 Autotransporter beta-domain-containing protein [Flavobacterium caeni]
MKKTILLLALFGIHCMGAQETAKEPIFAMGPMVRVHGIYSLQFGDHYLADANDPQVSFGMNLSLFDVYGFRLAGGIDHLFYKTHDIEMAADVSRTKYTAVYGAISYDIPITEKFLIQPYVGVGWANLNFKRSDENGSSNFYADFDNVGVSSQQGAEVRVGVYFDYRLAKVVSVFTGVNYIYGSYDIDTAREYRDYFGNSSGMQLNLGFKIGLSKRDKNKSFQ